MTIRALDTRCLFLAKAVRPSPVFGPSKPKSTYLHSPSLACGDDRRKGPFGNGTGRPASMACCESRPGYIEITQ